MYTKTYPKGHSDERTPFHLVVAYYQNDGQYSKTCDE